MQDAFFVNIFIAHFTIYTLYLYKKSAACKESSIFIQWVIKLKSNVVSH